MIKLLDAPSPPAIDLGKLQPAHPNLHTPLSQTFGEPTLFVIDAHTFPFKTDYMYALIDSLQQSYQLVLVARHGGVGGWVSLWEDYIGPFGNTQLIIAQPFQLSAHMRSALQNQPRWFDLLESIRNTPIAEE